MCHIFFVHENTYICTTEKGVRSSLFIHEFEYEYVLEMHQRRLTTARIARATVATPLHHCLSKIDAVAAAADAAGASQHIARNRGGKS